MDTPKKQPSKILQTLGSAFKYMYMYMYVCIQSKPLKSGTSGTFVKWTGWTSTWTVQN